MGNPYDPIYEARLQGWAQAWESRQREVDQLQHTADRLYMAAFNPPPKIDPNRPTYAQLERIRGNAANADRIETELHERLRKTA